MLERGVSDDCDGLLSGIRIDIMLYEHDYRGGFLIL